MLNSVYGCIRMSIFRPGLTSHSVFKSVFDSEATRVRKIERYVGDQWSVAERWYMPLFSEQYVVLNIIIDFHFPKYYYNGIVVKGNVSLEHKIYAC